MDEISYAFVVPDVATRCDEQCLARRNRVEADTALGAVDASCVRIAALVDARALEQALVGRCVEVVEALLPATVALDANFDASEDDFLATLEIDS